MVDAFTAKFVEATRALVMGDPASANTYVGPMARFDLRDELHGQVQATLEEGATLLLGGNKVAGAGNYYEPTVLANVTDQMTSFKQELFGPWPRSSPPAMPSTPWPWPMTASLA